MMDENTIKELEKKAIDIRVSVLESLVSAGSGHTAGPLGMADIFTALYFHIMKHNPKKPDWKDRDYLILSNGHICPVLYATMAHAGYFPKSELKNLRKLGSPLQGHPHREWMKGLETSSGPLGSGLSQAVGMAIADRMDNGITSDKTFYCLMSDGEIQEGQTWEAIMLAGKEKLQNIIAIIDRNNIQIEGNVEDIMPLEPLDEKFEAFNWHTIEIDGHNFEQINNAVNEAKAITEKPVVIIAYTIPGKGIKEWEKKYEWHGKPPTKEEAERAIKELKAEM
ncbi:TPA: transketolase [Candidatus Campbellbacteria bacterium]|nr:MAG: transketolase, transketolase [Candidatus Campbellbacteria bacterium GW2011_OD1_34_28]KKP74642.1 MAG: Transketolase domain protein [Candidatus Campbellbacteria bacterium GW2011_GWD2_35_24]KKP76774.1 MAG: Transketolase domain protein [Candidatus Campbellbacteria bacterium GW2011_GWC1_35_31]KKP78655.1 MAG: Transketolase domain protein [Candidatus Campbellbacteria bacterium GW2011_GWD1_35_49]HAP74401.1 transketolase [Candidatus Campbellbacteria bacterium]